MPTIEKALDLTLVRFWTPDGMLGRLFFPPDHGLTLCTAERPWLDNRPFVSCIPEGRYKLAFRWFYRGRYWAIEVLDVPGRTHILLHRGRGPRHVKGCIVTGLEFGYSGGEFGVNLSKSAHEALMAVFPKKVGGWLTIRMRREGEEL